jgi:hypothetical protein
MLYRHPGLDPGSRLKSRACGCVKKAGSRVKPGKTEWSEANVRSPPNAEIAQSNAVRGITDSGWTRAVQLIF